MQIPSSSVAAYGSREVEQLSYQSVQFELSLTDNRGRSVDLSFSSEQLSYSRTYDQFGIVGISKGAHANRGEQARAFTLGAIAEQHESVQLDYSSTSLEIEGDASLLADYFSSDATAQRIFDYITGLNPGFAADSPDFSNFVEQISSGVQAGFEQAQSILGDLPEIVEETKQLLDMMLAQLQSGEQVQSASQLLAEKREEESDAGA